MKKEPEDLDIISWMGNYVDQIIDERVVSDPSWDHIVRLAVDERALAGWRRLDELDAAPALKRRFVSAAILWAPLAIGGTAAEVRTIAEKRRMDCGTLADLADRAEAWADWGGAARLRGEAVRLEEEAARIAAAATDDNLSRRIWSDFELSDFCRRLTNAARVMFGRPLADVVAALGNAAFGLCGPAALDTARVRNLSRWP